MTTFGRDRVLYLLREKKGPRQWKVIARLLRLPRSYLSEVASGKKHPGPKILRWLGIEAVEAYRLKGRREKGN